MALHKRSEKGRKLTHIEVDENWSDIENRLSQKAAAQHTHTIGQIYGLASELGSKLPSDEKGAADGLATLDAAGKLSMSQWPNMQSDARGQLFFQDTLTQDDVGKLAIWKDGKVQLPVFEPAVPYSPYKIEFEMNSDSLQGFKPDHLVIEFTGQPVDGDELFIEQSLTLYFKNVATDVNEVEIGASLSDTIDALKLAIDNSPQILPYIEVVKEDDKLHVYAHNLHIRFSGGINFSTDTFADSAITGSYGSLSSYYVSPESRAGDTLVPYLFLKGLSFVDIEYSYDGFVSFHQNITSFTQQIYGGDQQAYNLPSSLSELQDGIVEYLLTVEDVADAYWVGLKLIVKVHDLSDEEEDSGTVDIDIDLVDFWNNYFSNGEILEYPGGNIAYCQYAVVGQIKTVLLNQVEINPHPISDFPFKGEFVPAGGVLSFDSYYVLDSQHPGYVVCLDEIEPQSFFDIMSAIYPCVILNMSTTPEDSDFIKGKLLYDGGSISFIKGLFFT